MGAALRQRGGKGREGRGMGFMWTNAVHVQHLKWYTTPGNGGDQHAIRRH